MIDTLFQQTLKQCYYSLISCFLCAIYCLAPAPLSSATTTSPSHSVYNGWPLPKPCKVAPWPSSFITYGAVGMRCDKFKWSIAGLDNFPNTLSELQWRNLRIVQYQAMAQYTSCTNYVIRLDADYGNIYHGKFRDTDFAGNGKTDPFSLHVGDAGQGYVYDLSIGAGYRVTSNCNRFIAAPLIGYSQHSQYLHMYHGNAIFDIFHPIGPYPGLNSHYTTRWFGPWLGMDFEARVERCASLFGVFKWHMLTYRGHGHWNLRTDIGPFYQNAYGYGYEGILGGKWEIWGNWSIGLMGTYKMFRTKSGHEKVEIIERDGSSFIGVQHFNGAILHSFNLSGMIGWRY